jgi:23S rRNA pseudouridine2605 synthase
MKSKIQIKTKNTNSKVKSHKILVRVHKIIADSGLCSRRNAEALISAGRVKVNGEYAIIGQSANPKIDKITVDDQPLEQQQKRYIIMHKPFGIHTTTKDPYTERTVTSILEKAGIKERLYPVGRLDKNASGLLLLTNDGEWANSVIHPSIGFEKEYHAKTNKALSSKQISAIKKGIHLNDGFVQAKIKPVSRGFYSLTLKAGRNKIVKRIFKYFDLHVTGLKRVRIGPYKLGTLKIGEIKEIKPATIKQTKRTTRTKADPKISRFKRERIKIKLNETARKSKKLAKREHLKKVSPKIDKAYTKRRRDRERGVTTKKEPRAKKHSRGARFQASEDSKSRDKRYPTERIRERKPRPSIRDQLKEFKRNYSSNQAPNRTGTKDFNKGLKSKSKFTPFDKNKPITSKRFKETKRDNRDKVPRKKRAPINSYSDEEFSKSPQVTKDPKRLHVAKASKPFDLKKALRKAGKKKDPMKAKKGSKKRWS